jgi:hypothetical protein
LICIQFIPNPQNLPEVDHINGIRNDNRLQNLRWCSKSTNDFNRHIASNGFHYEYFDNLPEGSRPFLMYNNHDFEGYSIDNDHNIYFYNSVAFRKLQTLTNHQQLFYRLTDIIGRYVNVYLNNLQ